MVKTYRDPKLDFMANSQSFLVQLFKDLYLIIYLSINVYC